VKGEAAMMLPEIHSSNSSTCSGLARDAYHHERVFGVDVLYLASDHLKLRCYRRGPTLSRNSLQAWEQLTCREMSLVVFD
jgi:hypothetical protein